MSAAVLRAFKADLSWPPKALKARAVPKDSFILLQTLLALLSCPGYAFQRSRLSQRALVLKGPTLHRHWRVSQHAWLILWSNSSDDPRAPVCAKQARGVTRLALLCSVLLPLPRRLAAEAPVLGQAGGAEQRRGHKHHRGLGSSPGSALKGGRSCWRLLQPRQIAAPLGPNARRHRLGSTDHCGRPVVRRSGAALWPACEVPAQRAMPVARIFIEALCPLRSFRRSPCCRRSLGGRCCQCDPSAQPMGSPHVISLVPGAHGVAGANCVAATRY